MAKSLNGTNQYLTHTTQNPTPTGSFAWWGQPDVFRLMVGMYWSDGTTASDYNGFGDTLGGLEINDGIDGSTPRVDYEDGENTKREIKLGEITLDVWNHFCVTLDTADLMKAYLDGIFTGSGLLSNLPNLGIDATVMQFGRPGDGTTARHWSGLVAEIAIWNVELSAAEVLILGKGYSPLFVRPQGLIFYAPLIRNNVEIISGDTMVDNGSPTVVAHPPMIYPAMPFTITAPAAVAAAGWGKLLGRSRNRLILEA